jgi:hypothetical protein
MVKVFGLIVIVLAKVWVVTPENIVPSDSALGSQPTDNAFQTAIENAGAGDTLLLKVGRYEAIPKPYREAICGNCVDPLTEVNATVGFHIQGKPLVIIGEDRDSTVLVTNGGYGILFEKSYGSYIGNLTVTGGIRDPMAMQRMRAWW